MSVQSINKSNIMELESLSIHQLQINEQVDEKIKFQQQLN